MKSADPAPGTPPNPTPPLPFDPARMGPAARLMSRLGLTPALHWRHTRIARVLTPLQEFLHQSASGGVVLMAATILALAIANSPLHESYERLLHLYVGVSVGSYGLKLSLLHWINDGLMALFFLLVGLEIKREVIVGELSNARAALLPVVAAAGGAIVPALIYAAFNFGGAGLRGWAVPMATDIAFTLGVLALLGRRVPLSLKIFLTAVAIADDLMAVLVIAIFYSGALNFAALGLALAVLGVLLACNFLGVRSLLVYLGLGLVVWVAFLQSGVHATIAGVLVAWTIPARLRLDPAEFSAHARELLRCFESSDGALLGPMLTNEEQQRSIAELEDLCEGMQAPLQRLEYALHTPVSFVVVPIFALANAGVALSTRGLTGEALPVVGGIAAGLVLGKPIGLMLASFLVVRSGAADLPESVTWRQMGGASVLCGIGFTMSLFVASLGFGQGPLLEAAKAGILLASLVAGVAGYFLLRKMPPTTQSS